MTDTDIFLPINQPTVETKMKDSESEPLIGEIDIDSVTSIELETNRQTRLRWILTCMYVISYASFLVLTNRALRYDKEHHKNHTQYSYLFIASLFGFIGGFFIFMISDHKKITKKDLIYNLVCGFFNSCFLTLLFYSSDSEQTTLTQQSILIGSSFMGYASFTYLWRYKSMRAVEIILALLIFSAGIGSTIYFLFKNNSPKIFQYLYLLAHICHGVYSGLLEHMWIKNKNKDNVSLLLTSMFTFIFVLTFSGFHSLSYTPVSYIKVWESFEDMNANGYVACILLYKFSFLLHYAMHTIFKGYNIFITLLVPISVFVVSLLLEKGEIEEIIVMSVLFILTLVFSVFKIREIIKRHKIE